jgi:hypothetical protein
MQVIAGVAFVFIITGTAAQQLNISNGKILLLQITVDWPYWKIKSKFKRQWEESETNINSQMYLFKQVCIKKKLKSALNGRLICCYRLIPLWPTRWSSSTDLPALHESPIRSNRTWSAWTTSSKTRWIRANGLSTKAIFLELLLWRWIFAGKFERFLEIPYIICIIAVLFQNLISWHSKSDK